MTGLAACLVAPAARAQHPIEPEADLYLPPPGVSSRNDLYLPGSATPGQAATPDFLDDIDAMFKIEEGTGLPRIRILFQFGCPRSPELYARIRPMLDRARFDWIPVPSPNAPADAPAAALFAPGASPRTLRDVFAGHKSSVIDPEPARKQGRLFVEKIGPELYRETNRPFATPTLAYRGRDAEARIIRGAPDLGALRTIVASAR
jgi:hypothetical protein